MRGPIDYLIVGFEGNKFTGEVLRELHAATSNGIIAVLALVLVSKDENGVVTTVELDEEYLRVTASFDLDNTLISDDDVAEVGDVLENNTAAGLLIVEQLWAKGLKQAIANAGGYLVADGRIHPDASEELNSKEDA